MIMIAIKINSPDYIYDFIGSKPLVKSLHEWEQSTVDPFIDSGTTVIAALNLKRNFIEIEKDPEQFEIAKSRFSKLLVGGS